jgi:hypothetical protein
MKDGRTVTHPGQGNPDIVEPAGPVDPEVGVIGAWDAEDPGRLLGCIVNFACHATTSPGGISANYIHELEKVIRGYYGKECVVVFLAGASGDITQVDNRSPYRNPSDERWSRTVGGKVGAEALKVLLTMEPGTLAPVAARGRVWAIERRIPAPERVQRSLDLVQRDPKGVDPTEWTFAKETVLLDALLKKEPAAEVEVQAVQVGPAVFVATPAEYFCRYGLEIKAASGFPFTFPVSLANGCVGYVPTEDAFGPRGGGYETRLTSYSNLEITAGTQMRDAGIALSRQLRPGTVPEPPRHPPFAGKPWPYGDVAPSGDESSPGRVPGFDPCRGRTLTSPEAGCSLRGERLTSAWRRLSSSSRAGGSPCRGRPVTLGGEGLIPASERACSEVHLANDLGLVLSSLEIWCTASALNPRVNVLQSSPSVAPRNAPYALGAPIAPGRLRAIPGLTDDCRDRRELYSLA